MYKSVSGPFIRYFTAEDAEGAEIKKFEGKAACADGVDAIGEFTPGG
jgi:hypothetical protein